MVATVAFTPSAASAISKVAWETMEHAMHLVLTPGKALNIFAAMLVAVGTVLLFRGSFAYESFGMYHSRETIAAMSARNSRRRLLQRLGLSCLLGGVALQAVTQFVD